MRSMSACRVFAWIANCTQGANLRKDLHAMMLEDLSPYAFVMYFEVRGFQNSSVQSNSIYCLHVCSVLGINLCETSASASRRQ